MHACVFYQIDLTLYKSNLRDKKNIRNRNETIFIPYARNEYLYCTN